MYRKQQRLLRQRLESILREKYQLEVQNLAIELPPDLGLGEFASPVAFELARRLKKPPRKIAEELVPQLTPLGARHKTTFLATGRDYRDTESGGEPRMRTTSTALCWAMPSFLSCSNRTRDISGEEREPLPRDFSTLFRPRYGPKGTTARGVRTTPTF